MIQLPRSLARQLRAVCRRLSGKASSLAPSISFDAGDSGCRIRFHHTEIAAEYHQSGQWPVETLVMPATALADFEGRKDDIVTLERHGSDILARWGDGGVPREMKYEAQDAAALSVFPDLPENMVSNEPGFLRALADATQSSAREAIRYAVNHLQLRGGLGQVVATDGRQLLLQSGFQFPWTDDVLVPASAVFGCPQIPQDVPVSIGKTDTHVPVRAGLWTLFLPIDKDGRFPRAEDVIPVQSAASARWRIDPADAVFLAKVLKRLPAGNDSDIPAVTVDLNGQPVIRVKAAGQTRATELVMPRSTAEGKPVRVNINRSLLARVLQLGFREICVVKAESPILCQEERRKFVVMPLSKETDDALRVTSSDESPSPEVSTPTPQRIPTMSAPETNGNATPQANGHGVSSLIAEVEELRTALHDAYLRSGKLLVAIKRQKKQAQVVQSTLAALKGLQQVGS